MRRRSASSTSTCRPSISKVSPTDGTRPIARQDVPANCFEAVGFDLHVEPIANHVDVDLRAEHVRAVAFLDDRLGLDVVLVADLADDLLEQILERHQAGSPAVLVHHDRHLHLLPLELLEELGDALGLRHEGGRAHQRGERRRRAGREVDQVLHEDDAEDVVQVLLVDGETGVLLLAEPRAQLIERGVGA